MYRVHTLPTRPTKDPPADEVGSREGGRSALRSVEDRPSFYRHFVNASPHSLDIPPPAYDYAARQTWLTSAFTKFSTKSRGGKGSDIWQPPHTIRFRGKCDLEIGPHVFYATSVYEVTYQPYSAPIHAPSPYHAPSGQKTAVSPAGPYTQPTTSQVSPASAQGKTAPLYTPSTTALVSSLKGAVPITNELIAQVNIAALSNPTLANLLGLAASGSATTEQLSTLGVTIQSLADTVLKPANSGNQPQSGSSAPVSSSKLQSSTASESTSATNVSQPPGHLKSTAPQPPILSLRPSQASSSNPGTTPPQQPAQPAQIIYKEPDVVIEFYENSYDRWTLPKNQVLYERVKRWDGNNSLADIIFSTIFPFEGSRTTLATPAQSSEPSPVPQDSIHPMTLRFFNVPPAIWNLFAQAAGDEERTKRVKAAIDSQLDRAAARAYLQHRISEGPLLTQLQASASDRYSTKLIRPTVPAAGTSQGKRRAPAVPKEGLPAGGLPPKRKRTQPKKTESRTGTCDICKRASVVLAPDSPYCPPCTKKVGHTPVAASISSGVVPAADTNASQSTAKQDTNAGSAVNPPVAPSTTPADAQKQMQPVMAPTVFKHSVPGLYGGGTRLPVQNYYAWQAQAPYAYHAFQAHPHPQSQPQPGQSNPTPAQPIVPVPPPQPPPTTQSTQARTQSTPKKSNLKAMD